MGRLEDVPMTDEEQALLMHLRDVVVDGWWDVEHHWRCEAWQNPERPAKRIKGEPDPRDPRCTCGLTAFLEVADEL